METAKPVLSPRELAEAVGVSESSIKRWADDGTLRAARTAGGHRRIPLAEAIRFVRSSQLRMVKPELLGLGEVAAVAADPQVAGEEAERLFGFLRTGAAVEARGLLLALYMEGRSVAEIVDGPLRAALERLGELWCAEPAGIFWEHRATDIAIQALSQLRSRLPAPPQGAPAAVGGAPAGDPYILPSLSVAAVLRDVGIAATNLGPETPLPVLAEAAAALDAGIVWLSLSGELAEPGVLEAEVRRLVAALEGRGATLLVGGRRRDRVALPRHPNLLVCASMGELAAFTRGLAQRDAGGRDAAGSG